jgi:hypothetical protein
MRCSICNARFPFEKSVPNHICLDGKLNGCSCTAPALPDTGHGADEARVAWTSTPPTEPGWYWCDNGLRIEPVYRSGRDDEYGDAEMLIARMRRWWPVRIEEPPR